MNLKSSERMNMDVCLHYYNTTNTRYLVLVVDSEERFSKNVPHCVLTYQKNIYTFNARTKQQLLNGLQQIYRDTITVICATKDQIDNITTKYKVGE